MSLKRAAAVAILSVGGTVFVSAAASANVIWSYTGKNFTNVASPYTTSDSVKGTMTLSSPLAANLNIFGPGITPLAFSFTDGVQTISNLTDNAGQTYFDFATNGSGIITGWNINIVSAANSQDKIDLFNGFGFQKDSGTESVGGNRDEEDNTRSGTVYSSGSFVDPPATVPEPITISLFSTGLAGSVAMRRRKKKTA